MLPAILLGSGKDLEEGLEPPSPHSLPGGGEGLPQKSNMSVFDERRKGPVEARWRKLERPLVFEKKRRPLFFSGCKGKPKGR